MESGCIRSCRLKESGIYLISNQKVQYNAMSYGVWMYPELSPKGVRDLPALKPEGTIQCNELWSLDVSGAIA